MTETVQNPENLFVTLTAKDRFHLTVPMMIMDKAGNEIKAPMVCLTAREEREAKQKAYNETIIFFKDKPKKDEQNFQEAEDIFKELFNHNINCWIFFYSVRVPGDLEKRLFISKQQVEDQYTYEQLGILASAAMSVKMSQPYVKFLQENDTDGFNQLIDQIIASGTEPDFFLNGYTSQTYKNIIHYLVKRLETLTSEAGVSGSLSDSTS